MFMQFVLCFLPCLFYNFIILRSRHTIHIGSWYVYFCLLRLPTIRYNIIVYVLSFKYLHVMFEYNDWFKNVKLHSMGLLAYIHFTIRRITSIYAKHFLLFQGCSIPFGRGTSYFVGSGFFKLLLLNLRIIITLCLLVCIVILVY